MGNASKDTYLLRYLIIRNLITGLISDLISAR